VLSEAELAASQIAGVAPMSYGNALEGLVGQVVDDNFGSLLSYTGRGAGPDFVGVGNAAGEYFDLTTAGAIPAHLARSYGPWLDFIIYVPRLALRAFEMTRVYAEEEFDDFKDRDSAALFSDLEFKRCLFSSCSLSRTDQPSRRSRIHHIRILDCEAAGCFLGPAIVEETVVDGLKIPKRLIAEGSVFKHVILKGRIDRLLLYEVNPNLVASPEYRAKVRETFDQANAEYYKTVDWALDISQAEFLDFNVRGIPSRLIRRDPFTQAVVKYEKAMNGEWKKLDLSGTWWPVALEMLAKSNWEDAILIAPKRHRQFSQALKGIYVLRDAGIAEPD
jgi:hypothetical protein